MLSKIKNILKIIKRFITGIMNWKSLWKAFLDLLLILFFTTLATIMALISMFVKNDKIPDLDSLYNDGNFFLYAISILSTSLIYYLRKKDNEFGKYVIMILVILCALIYSQFIGDITSTTSFTKYGSIIVMLLASITLLITQYHQNLILVDINEEDDENQNELARGIIF